MNQKGPANIIVLIVVAVVVAGVGGYFYLNKQQLPHPPLTIQTDPEAPKIKVSGDITSFVKNFLEPAPTGYKWEYRLDWDETIIEKCLVNAAEKGGAIDWDVTYKKIKFSGQPSGYRWVTRQGTSNTLIELCLSRIKCPYGKISNSKECVVPL